MTRVELTDESGQVYLAYRGDPNDPLAQVLEVMESLDYQARDIVLPDELPRTLQVHDPDWDAVIKTWQAEGDSQAFRRLLSTNQLRKVLHE